MKKTILILSFALAVTAATSQAVTFPLTLLNFGSSTYTLDPASSPMPGQTTTNLSYSSATIALADTFYNSALTLAVPDWTPYKNSLVLYMSVSSISASTPFTLSLFDSSSASVNYSGTAAVTSGLERVVLTLSPEPTFDYANILGVAFTWGGSASSVTSTIQEVQAVPEPSTYALVGMGALALSGYVARRRRRA